MSGVVSNLPTKNTERRKQHLSALVKCATTIAQEPGAHSCLQRSLAVASLSVLPALRPMQRTGGAKAATHITFGRRVRVAHHLRPESSVRRVSARVFGRARIDGRALLRTP